MAERMIEANGIRLWTEDFGDRGNPTLLTFDGMGHDLPVAVWPEMFREMLAVTQRARA